MADRLRPAPGIVPSLRRLLQVAGRHRAWFYAAIAIDLVLAVLVIVQNAVLRGLFDAVTASNQPAFFTNALLSIGISLINSPISYLRSRSLGQFSERTMYAIRHRLAERFTGLPVSYMEERHSGDFLSVVNADLAKIKNLMGSDLLDLMGQSSRGIFSLLYIISISWQLTVISLVMTPLVFLVLARLSAPIAKRTAQMQEETGSLNSVAQDSLAGLPIAKAFNLAALLDERFRQGNQAIVRSGLAVARMRSAVEVLSLVVGFTPFLIVFGVGGYLAISGAMTFGGIFAFVNLLNYVVNPLGNIPRLVASISESAGAAQRILQVLDHDQEPAGGTISHSAGAAEPVRFADLSFSYETGKPILKNISFAIQPGEKIAIVGPSGGGKSTLLKLLLGFYPLPDGCIYLFGEDLNRWQLAAARRQMAFVAQDTYLFPVSIEENIACGRLGAGRQDIRQAAEAANIHGFIQSLPDGYQTPVGERGARLSGGQQQRLSLARAILKDAPLLLMDEPTSALDSESEALVQQALDRFMQGRTSIVIAHRLSTIKNADRILVLDEGRIVQEGSHEDLLAQGGLYQDLYQQQFGLVQPAGQTS